MIAINTGDRVPAKHAAAVEAVYLIDERPVVAVVAGDGSAGKGLRRAALCERAKEGDRYHAGND